MSGYATLTRPTGLPNGWVIAPLGEYLYLKNGFAFKSNSYVEKSEQTVPVIRISDNYRKLALDDRASHVSIENSAEGFEIKNGDLLIAMSGATTGKVGVYCGTEPAYQNQRVGNLKLHSDQLSSAGFRNHLISSLSSDILKIAYGGAQPNISGKAIEEITIAFPPLAEQQQIAAKLDEMLAQVDILKTRLDTIPKILKRFRQSVLAAAVSGMLTENWRKTNQVEDWQFAQLCELNIEVQIGPFGSLLHKSDYIEGGIPLVNPMHINNGKINPSEFMTVTPVKAIKLQRYTLQIGDIVLGRRGKMSRAAVVNKVGLICGTGSLYLRPNLDNFEPVFIWLVLSASETIKFLEENSVGTTMVNLNQKILKNLPFPKVELEEQTEIVTRVEQLFAYAGQIEQRVKDAQARVNHLSQSILAKAFRGELTAEWREQNPDLISGENSAEALLARIKSEREMAKPGKQPRRLIAK